MSISTPLEPEGHVNPPRPIIHSHFLSLPKFPPPAIPHHRSHRAASATTDAALAGANATALFSISSTSSKLSTAKKATVWCTSFLVIFYLWYNITIHTNYFTAYQHTLSDKSFLRKEAPGNQTNPATICEPRAHRFLFVISAGRSGSTSLMTMLDKLPHVRMAGENNNALLGIKKLTDQLKTIQGLFTENSGPWQHHAVPKDNLPCIAQNVMESINPPAAGEFYDPETILGFKTIRFVGDSWKGKNKTEDAVETAVTFVKHHFPCSRVVVNIRSDLKALEKSRSRLKEFKNVPISILKHDEDMLRKVAKLFGHQAYLVDSTEWASPNGGVNVINKMVKWLGFQECTFNTTVHDNHNGYKQDSSVIDLGEKCRFSQVNASPCW